MDWNEWSKLYDTDGSLISKRLIKVKEYLKDALINFDAPTILNICSGQGRETLESIVELNKDCTVFLIDLDQNTLNYAKDFSIKNNLKNINFINEDASQVSTYINYKIPKCDIVIASGLFGHLTEIDCHNLIDFIKTKIKYGGYIIWTRNTEDDVYTKVRKYFTHNGFDEIDFYQSDSKIWSVVYNQYFGNEESEIKQHKIFNFYDGD